MKIFFKFLKFGKEFLKYFFQNFFFENLRRTLGGIFENVWKIGRCPTQFSPHAVRGELGETYTTNKMEEIKKI